MEKYKICPSCGKQNSTRAIECRFCEMSLAGVKPTDDESEAARKGAEEKEERENSFAAPMNQSESVVRICSECGTHNPANARKCSSCGGDISDILPTSEMEISPQQESCFSYSLHSYDGKYEYHIPEEGCIVGRENAMSYYLMGKSFVSRRHASLSVIDGRLVIENLSHSNPTFVNNKVINEPTDLAEGDEVSLGGNVIGEQRQEMAAYFIVKIG